MIHNTKHEYIIRSDIKTERLQFNKLKLFNLIKLINIINILFEMNNDIKLRVYCYEVL